MRRRRTPTFDDYLFRACQRLHELGGSVDSVFQQGAGTDLVILEARITFPDDVELQAFELIEKTISGAAHRRKYRYQCRWHGQLLLRYDREPIRHPEMPEHKHLPDGSRIPCSRVSIHDVAEEMWDELAKRKARRVDRPGEAEKQSA
jgi:hypothetical protein